MGENTSIAWTDHTFNPWWGCQRVSPGCENCYAETFAHRLRLPIWGPKSDRRFFGNKHWNEPLKWNAAAAKSGIRVRVFCASMADVFEDRAELREHRARLHTLIRATPALDWLLLTKRPQNVARLWHEAHVDAFNGADSLGLTWDRNAWLGVTAEDQRRADERIPVLLGLDGPAVRFVSYEPAIGPVDFRPWLHDSTCADPDVCICSTPREVALDWIIVGGESGHGARPFDVEWAGSTIDECAAAGVACFVKQLGAKPIDHPTRDHKGGDMAEWPEEIRVRQFPRMSGERCG